VREGIALLQWAGHMWKVPAAAAYPLHRRNRFAGYNSPAKIIVELFCFVFFFLMRHVLYDRRRHANRSSGWRRISQKAVTRAARSYATCHEQLRKLTGCSSESMRLECGTQLTTKRSVQRARSAASRKGKQTRSSWA